MKKPFLSRFPHEQIVLWSLFIAITCGVGLLSLPAAQTHPISFLDTVFTIVSAVTVNGLFTIPIDQFSLFGQFVILVFIQIGGLGLITLTLFLITIFIEVGLNTQVIVGHILEIDSWKHVKKMILLIISVTFICEFVGTLCVYAALPHVISSHMAWFVSCFHAISSFCSAGVTLLPGGIGSYTANYPIIITTMLLIYVGELGFITWQEIGNWIYSWKDKKPYRFSLHSKLVLYGSSMLLICSSIVFWILEHNNSLANQSGLQSAMSALFYAISFKSTGFIFTSLLNFHLATILLIMVLCFIGSAPGSTGSGIKITTFIIVLNAIKAAVSGRAVVTMYGRTVPNAQVFRAIGIVGLGLTWVLFSTFCLLITEQEYTFLQILFASMSAFSSLGISSGAVESFSEIGKTFIMITMLIGRMGSFSLILALKLKHTPEIEATYPEERVMLG